LGSQRFDEPQKGYTFVAVSGVGCGMREWAILLLVAAMSLPAQAAKSVSVEQLEQLLAQNQGKPDARVAQQLSDLELSERVSEVRMVRWEA
jgi:hypothetical protein